MSQSSEYDGDGGQVHPYVSILFAFALFTVKYKPTLDTDALKPWYISKFLFPEHEKCSPVPQPCVGLVSYARCALLLNLHYPAALQWMDG